MRALSIRAAEDYHPIVTKPQEFRQLAGRYALVRADLAEHSLDDLWAMGSPLAHAKGREGVRVLELTASLRGVSRDYRRGGALRNLLPRSYLDYQRPQRELALLCQLSRLGVPVVQPLAALARRRMLVFYRLRLITELVPDARPLPAMVLAQPAFRAPLVVEAGRVVAAAFDAGLLHPDLHPDNLVARVVGGRVEVYLLDLDRAVLRPKLPVSARDPMLLRMVRYLRRHAADLPVRPRLADTLRFLAGMGLDRVARRREIARLQPLYVEELCRHGLSAKVSD